MPVNNNRHGGCSDAAQGQECHSCKRMNCPCGPSCECGKYCRCVANDIIEGVDSVHFGGGSSAPTENLVCVQLKIGGMTCTNCSSAVTRAVSFLNGHAETHGHDPPVVSCDISLVLHTGEVVIRAAPGASSSHVIDIVGGSRDENERSSLLRASKATNFVTVEDVVDAVESAGYEASVLQVVEDYECEGDGRKTDAFKKSTLVISAKRRGKSSLMAGWSPDLTSAILQVVQQIKESLSPSLKHGINDNELVLEYVPGRGLGGRSFQRYFSTILGPGFDVSVKDVSVARRPDVFKLTKEQLEKKRSAFVFSLLGTIPVFCTSMILSYIPAFEPFLRREPYPGLTIEELILFAGATPVQFISGWTFYVGAYKSIKNGSLGMDILVVCGTTASYLYGLAGLLEALVEQEPNMASHFFETSAVLITFVLMGKYLQLRATRTTSKALKRLMELTPPVCTLVTKRKKDGVMRAVTDINDSFMTDEEFDPDLGYDERQIDVKDVQTGDVLKLIRGASIPCDGNLLHSHKGEGIMVNECMITGESLPVLKANEGNLIGGTLVVSLKLRILCVYPCLCFYLYCLRFITM